MKPLALALLLMGCGLIDDLEEAIDPPPETIRREHKIRQCAHDSTTAADTANYALCGWEPRPPSPGIPGIDATLGNGGAL